MGRDAEEKFIGIVREGALTQTVTKKRKATRSSENVFGWPPCVYFFAGRVHPDAAHVCSTVLLLGGALENELDPAQKLEHRLRGGCTPFDSGGLARGISHLTPIADASHYVNDHRVTDLKLWRQYLALFLTAFFDKPSDYWEGGPSEEIDGVDFTTIENDRKWLDWTFEIQAEDEVELERCRFIHASESVVDFLDGEAERYPEYSMVRPRIRRTAIPARDAEDEMKGLALDER